MNAVPTPARVRVVMRTRNRPRLLERAVAGLLAQDFDSWELIVVNHRGDRGAIERTLEARRKEFPRTWQIIDTDHAIGRDAILTEGLHASRAEFIAIHDDDDMWHPRFLTETVSWLDAHGDDLAVAVTTDIVRERVDADDIVELERETITPPFGRVSLYDLLRAPHIPPIGILFRSRSIADVGGFDESLSVLGDWDLLLRIAVAGPIGFIDGEPLAEWRQRPTSAGDLANSVIGDLDLHKRTDRELRDRAIRDYVKRNGIGELLFLSRYIDEQFAQGRHDTWLRVRELESRLESQTDALAARLEEAIRRETYRNGVVGTVRRAARRLFPRR